MEFICRPTVVADTAAIESVLSASYTRLWANDYTPEILALVLPYMTSARSDLVGCGTYFGVWYGDDMVACGGWTRERPAGGGAVPGIGHIRHVAVHPDWLRRGVGGRLMAHTLQDAQAAGVAQLECASSLTAKPFYEAIGFKVLESAALPFGSDKIPFEVALMRYTAEHAIDQA